MQVPNKTPCIITNFEPYLTKIVVSLQNSPPNFPKKVLLHRVNPRGIVTESF